MTVESSRVGEAKHLYQGGIVCEDSAETDTPPAMALATLDPDGRMPHWPLDPKPKARRGVAGYPGRLEDWPAAGNPAFRSYPRRRSHSVSLLHQPPSMKTVVIQPSQTGRIPGWINRCLMSVASWAALNDYDYLAADDSTFTLCGADYRSRVGGDREAITNLWRLELLRDAHRRGHDRAIWMDADVLVFRPELFAIDNVDRYAFTRETAVSKAADRWLKLDLVSNSVIVCMSGEPDLDMLIALTRHVGVHRKTDASQQTGSYLLTGLQKSLAFETLDNVAVLGNHVGLALARDHKDAVAFQAISHGTPVFAASFGLSDGEAPAISDPEGDVVAQRLLQSKGDVVNRWMLHSPNNLRHGDGKPGMAALFPQEVNVRLLFKQRFGYELDLARPRTFTERLAARKLTLTDDIHRITTDKYAVREFVKDRVGEEVLIPLLQVCDRAEDLDIDALPSAFVLKPTHGSGWKEIVRDKTAVDRDALRAKMRKWLRSNYFDWFFEAQYRNIPPRILAECLLLTPDGKVPWDYRCHVFHGQVRMISVTVDFGTPNVRSTRFDRSWRQLHVGGRRPSAGDLPPPSRLPQLIDTAEKLARDFDYARVDLYCFDDKVLFGEITHTPQAGLVTFKPAEFDAVLGRIWETGEPIPEKYYADRS